MGGTYRDSLGGCGSPRELSDQDGRVEYSRSVEQLVGSRASLSTKLELRTLAMK